MNINSKLALGAALLFPLSFAAFGAGQDGTGSPNNDTQSAEETQEIVVCVVEEINEKQSIGAEVVIIEIVVECTEEVLS